MVLFLYLFKLCFDTHKLSNKYAFQIQKRSQSIDFFQNFNPAKT